MAVRVDMTLCNLCGGCTYICEQEALRIEGDVLLVDEARCQDCGECVKNCAAGALVAA